MNYYKHSNIIKYLESRGWILHRTGNSFLYLKPINEEEYPENYTIEIPKQDNSIDFNNYIDRILVDIQLGTSSVNTPEDLKVLFCRDTSILKYRIFDNENNDGTISFQKHIDSLDGFKKLLTQAITFVSTGKQIFANAKVEVDFYLKQCKAMQTEKGSYVSKFEIPNDNIETAVSLIESSKINNRLLDVISFVNEEVIKPKSNIVVDENYISKNLNFINYELMNALKEIYIKTEINNHEFYLSSNLTNRKIVTEKVQPRIKYFNTYLKMVKKCLMSFTPIEVSGRVKQLSSISPSSSKNNQVIITAEIGNKEENIKLNLKSDQYMEALEAHKNEFKIKIKGKAKQGKTQLIISELEKFEVEKLN